MSQPLAEALVAALIDAGLTLSTAETDTGGLIGHWITDVPGCSRAWLGGAAPYTGSSKTELTRVPEAILREHGSVSEEAALAMAAGLREALGTDIGVSETGITGPTGGSGERPVGTVWIACVGPGERVRSERNVWDADREGNKRRTAERALEMVREAVDAAI